MRPRDNPFRSERIDRVPYRLDGASWSALAERVLEQRGRMSVVGPHGAGKTRFLRELEGQLQARGANVLRFRLGTGRSEPSIEPGAVLLVDGFEGQPPWRRWWWSRRSRAALAVVVSLHARGREPVLYECRSSPALARELVDSLMEEIDAELRVGDAELRTLWDAHDGNMRGVFRALYDRFGRITDMGG